MPNIMCLKVVQHIIVCTTPLQACRPILIVYCVSTDRSIRALGEMNYQRKIIPFETNRLCTYAKDYEIDNITGCTTSLQACRPNDVLIVYISCELIAVLSDVNCKIHKTNWPLWPWALFTIISSSRALPSMSRTLVSLFCDGIMIINA